jgi:hypothetical protein
MRIGVANQRQKEEPGGAVHAKYHIPIGVTLRNANNEKIAALIIHGPRPKAAAMIPGRTQTKVTPTHLKNSGYSPSIGTQPAIFGRA